MLFHSHLPKMCTAEPAFAQDFARLKLLLKHPKLNFFEKTLWLWLASHCVQNDFVCCFNLQQLSSALNKSTREVHRALVCLKIVGFLLNEEVPISYGKLKPEIEFKMLHLQLRTTPFVSPPSGFNETLQFCAAHAKTKIKLNLIKESLSQELTQK